MADDSDNSSNSTIIDAAQLAKEAAELKKAKAVRRTVRGSTTTIVNSLRQLKEEQVLRCDDIEEQLALLLIKEKALQQLDDKIYDLLDNADDDQLKVEFDSVENYKNSITLIQGQVSRVLRKAGIVLETAELTATSTASLNSQKELASSLFSAVSETRLPPLIIQKFDGDVTEWQGFWSQFGALMERKKLIKVERFGYLKSYLSGPALKIIKNMKPSDANYDEAVKMLKNRFGRDELISHTHMQKLLKLEPVSSSNDLVGLRRLYDECETNIRSLRSLGVDTAVNGTFLCPKLLGCLPKDIRLEYTKKLGQKAEWNVDALVAFLQDEVENRETCDMLSEGINSSSKNEHEYRDKNKYISQKFDRRPRSQNSNQASTSVLSTQFAPRTSFCIFCKVNGHITTNCTHFTLEEKKKLILEAERCFICLRYGHLASDCPSKYNYCKICKNKHNAAICEQNQVNKKKDNNNKNKDSVQISSHTVACENILPEAVEISTQMVTFKNTVLLQTAKALAKNPSSGAGVQISCLLDPGSQASFVKEEVSRKLKLPVVGECEVLIRSFGNENPTESVRNIVKITLENSKKESEVVEILAVEVPYICEVVATEDHETIKQIQRQLKEKGCHLAEEADPKKPKNKSMDFLIGGDCYWEFATGNVEWFSRRLVAVETILGWAIQGPIQIGRAAFGSYAINVMKVSLYEKEISKTLKSFSELEALGVMDHPENDPSKNEMLENFQKEIKIKDGRYVVKFPWIRSKESLPNNFQVAKKRFDGLVRRFQRDPDLYSAYKAIIEEQIEQGVAEEVVNPEDQKPGTYYLPQQPVTRDSSATTKLRVVNDGSSHAAGALSLNDCLASGENLNPNLLGLLLKFRVHKVAIVADVTKAFLQISLDVEDRDSVRFLWPQEDENGKPKLNAFKTMRMARVPFGITSSPYLLAATIKTHAKKYEHLDPKTYEVLNESFYVDDLPSGGEDEASAYELSRSASKIMKDAKMELRKWQTNSEALRKKWGEETADPYTTIKFEGEASAKIQKVLGLVWDPDKDTLAVDVSNLIKSAKEIKKSKRSVLSTVAQIFDPVGFLSPFTIRAKILMHELWESGVKWDDPLDPEVSAPFEKWCAELEILQNIQIPRCYFSEKIIEKELHCFADASGHAYAAVIYIRYVTSNNEIKVSFVTSKSRVAPVKKLRIPKLELMGCLLGARLIHNVSKIFAEEVEVRMWTDSTAALYWVKSPAKQWKPFVQNRASEIKKMVDPAAWSHCPGKDNPADLPTRGVSAKDLKQSQLWWNGPPWLIKNISEWPKNSLTEHKPEEVEPEKRKTVMVVEIKRNKGIQELVDLSRHNSLNKNLRIIAYVLRVKQKIKKEKSTSGPITAEELIRAEIKLIQDVQRLDYGEEIAAMKENKPISKNSKIATLKPTINEQGLVCLGGRIDESDFSYATKHPIIINKDQILAQLIMIRSHEEIKHEGIQATITQAREKYWITAGRQLAKNIIRYCYRCKKFNAKPCDAPSGLLPKDRITEAPPFSVIGIDFAGPLLLKVSENTSAKAYICLFTCGVTRAIHLELVPSLSTYEFLMAFRRMSSRRGIPTTVYSDNAKTFVKANNDLKKMWKNIKDGEIREFFGEKLIQWKFIVERAPWWGGHYERLVKSTKIILRKNLGKASLYYTEMETVLIEAEAVINSRPITYVFNDVNEPEPLTPAHFLIGKRITCLPPQTLTPTKFPKNQIECARRLKYRQTLMERLFKRWKHEYLLQLRTAHHISLAKNEAQVKVGDVMIVQEDMTPKHMWKLGLVMEVFEGRDGKIRSCVVKLGSGSKIRRPIQLLYALEINSNDSNV